MAPRSAIEWLLAIDVAELTWEIQLPPFAPPAARDLPAKGGRAALRSIDMVGITTVFEDEADYYTRQNALSWRLDPVATNEIEIRLASYGFDQHSINTDVYVQAREVFV